MFLAVLLDDLPLQVVSETFYFKSQSKFLILKPHKNIYVAFEYFFPTSYIG